MEPEALNGLGERVHIISLKGKQSLLDLPDFLSANRSEDVQSGIRAWVAEKESDNSDRTDLQRRSFRFNPGSFQLHSRAFLKIQDGCNNECSYCRVQLARGESVSLKLSEVVDRCRRLVHKGYNEIVLTGVNISSYRDRNSDFTDLLTAIVEETSVLRVRLSSIEPEVIDERLCTILEHPRVCPHFHLPIQSASDSVLRKMKRKYTATQLAKAVGLLRECKTDPFIAADVIAGFPGESDEDSKKTAQFLLDHHFADIHVFSYSPRPGTAAYTMAGKVPESTVRERMNRLKNAAGQLKGDYAVAQHGRRESLIVEKIINDDKIQTISGLSGNYLRLCIDIPSSVPVRKGDIVPCVIGPQVEEGNICDCKASLLQ
jgi:threonylcarbamoyladenosine tRNA methylthiotransferase MtaB